MLTVVFFILILTAVSEESEATNGTPPQGESSNATLPGEVTDLVALSRDAAVELKWTPLEDQGITGYIVYKGMEAANLTPVGIISDPLYAWDLYVENGVMYFYAVQALNDSGVGPMSDVVNATPMGVPETPWDLQVEFADGEVRLTWHAPNESAGRMPVTGYTVYRGTDPGQLAPVAQLESELSFTDTDVEEDETYYYAVGAGSLFGQSELTPLVEIETEEFELWQSVVAIVIAIGLLALLVAVFTYGGRWTSGSKES
jgi:hypothetical protein